MNPKPLTRTHFSELEMMQGSQKVTVIRGSKVNSYVVSKTKNEPAK